MRKLREFIGINIDDSMPVGLYEDAREKEKYIKQYMLEIAETQDDKKDIMENWPFQDHEELD